LLEKGSRRSGAKKIIVRHGGVTKTGGLTSEELLSIGEVIRKGEINKNSFSQTSNSIRYGYDYKKDDINLRALVEEFNDGRKVIDFYSNRNFKDYNKGFSYTQKSHEETSNIDNKKSSPGTTRQPRTAFHNESIANETLKDTKKRLDTAVDEILLGNKQKEVLEKVSQKEQEEIIGHFGINLKHSENFTRTIDKSQIEHTLKKHSDSIKEEQRGNIAVSLDDIKNYLDIVHNADLKKYGYNHSNKPVVVSGKQVNGHFVVVEEVRTGKSDLAFFTMRKTKGQLQEGALILAKDKSPALRPKSLPSYDGNITSQSLNNNKDLLNQKKDTIEQISIKEQINDTITRRTEGSKKSNTQDTNNRTGDGISRPTTLEPGRTGAKRDDISTTHRTTQRDTKKTLSQSTNKEFGRSDILARDEQTNERTTIPDEILRTTTDLQNKRNDKLNYDLRDKENIALSKAERKKLNAKAKELIKKPLEDITLEDKDTLRLYTGDGGLDNITAGSFNQHFTNYETIKSIYKTLEDANFKFDKALEPAVGSGNFIGFAPNKKWDVVDIDKTNIQVVKKLYPQINKIHNSTFETFTGKNYDLIISNVPFASANTLAREHMFSIKPQFKAIHNFYFAHALEKLKPNGILAFMTSTSTLDGTTEAKKLREYIISQADVLGAYRLPQKSQSKNTHTDTMADIIFLQKRPKDTTSRQEELNKKFVNVVNMGDYPINSYLITQKGVLGKLEVGPDKTKMGRVGWIVTGEPNYSKMKIDYKPYEIKEELKQDENSFKAWNDFKKYVDDNNLKYSQNNKVNDLIITPDNKVIIYDKEFKFEDDSKSIVTGKVVSSNNINIKKIQALNTIMKSAEKYANNEYSPESFKNQKPNKEEIISTLQKHRAIFQERPYTKEEWDRLFPNNKIKTPIGEIKLGENQFAKLDPNIADPKNTQGKKQDRREYLDYIYKTLTKPTYIVKKDNVYKFIKEFLKDDSSTKTHASIIVEMDNLKINISNHMLDLTKVLNEINSADKIIFSPYSDSLLLSKEVTTKQVANPIPTSSLAVNESISDGTLNFNKTSENRRLEKTKALNLIQEYQETYNISPHNDIKLKEFMQKHNSNKLYKEFISYFDKDFKPSALFEEDKNVNHSNKTIIDKADVLDPYEMVIQIEKDVFAREKLRVQRLIEKGDFNLRDIQKQEHKYQNQIYAKNDLINGEHGYVKAIAKLQDDLNPKNYPKYENIKDEKLKQKKLEEYIKRVNERIDKYKKYIQDTKEEIQSLEDLVEKTKENYKAKKIQINQAKEKFVDNGIVSLDLIKKEYTKEQLLKKEGKSDKEIQEYLSSQEQINIIDKKEEISPHFDENKQNNKVPDTMYMAQPLQKNYMKDNLTESVKYKLLDEEALKKEAVPLSKPINSYSDFIKEFSFDKNTNRHFVKTPIGDVKVRIQNAFNHFTQNTHNENRNYISGAFVQTLKDPLFVVEVPYKNITNKVFYKPFLDDNNLYHLASFNIDKNGELLNKTFFELNNEAKLKRLINVLDKNLKYYKHSAKNSNYSATSHHNSMMDKSTYNESISEKENLVKPRQENKQSQENNSLNISKEVKKRYIDPNTNKVIEVNILKDAQSLPKPLSEKEFYKQFGTSSWIDINTPYRKVKFKVKNAWEHINKDNTYSKDRRYISGAFKKLLEDPLLIVDNKARKQMEYYAPFVDPNNPNKAMHLISIAKNYDGELVNKTFFEIEHGLNRVRNIINSEDKDIKYFKYSSPDIITKSDNTHGIVKGENTNSNFKVPGNDTKVSNPEIGDLSTNDKIITKKENLVKVKQENKKSQDIKDNNTLHMSKKDTPMSNHPKRLYKTPSIRPCSGIIKLRDKEIKLNTKYEPMTPLHIKKQVVNIVGNRLYFNKIKAKAKGYYQKLTGEIRVAKENDVEALAHEMAHYLDFYIRTGRNSTASLHGDNKIFKDAYKSKEFKDEIESFSYTNDKELTAFEGFAEYVRAYLTQYNFAKEKAPKFTQEFENILKETDLETKINRLQEDMHIWFNQGDEAQFAGLIGKKLGAKEKFLDALFATKDMIANRLIVNVFDRTHGFSVAEQTMFNKLQDAQNSPTKLLRLATGGHSATYEAIVKWGTPKVDKNGSLSFGGKSLKDVFDPVVKSGSKEDQKNFKDLMKYFAAVQAKEMLGQGKETPFSPSQIQTMLKMGDEKPVFKKVFDDYQKFNDRMLDFYVSMNYLTAKDVKNFKEKNKVYVPMQRIVEVSEGKKTSGGEFYRREGSAKNLKEIEENITEQLYHHVRAAMIANAKSKLFSQLQNHEDGSLFAVRLSPDSKELKVHIDQQAHKIAEVLENSNLYINEKGDIVELDENISYADVLENTIQALKDKPELVRFISFGHKPKNTGSRIEEVIIDGKREYFEIQKGHEGDILNITLNSLGGFQHNWFIRGLHAVKNFKTRSITSHPLFKGANFVRDSFEAQVFRKTKKLVNPLSGAKSFLNTDDTYKHFMLNGGGYGSIYEATTNSANAYDIFHDTKFHKFDRFMSADEYANRLAVAQNAIAQGKSFAEAAYQGRDLTLDFAMVGASRGLRWALKLMPFQQAGINGLYKLIREIKDGGHNPKTYAYATAKLSLYGLTYLAPVAVLAFFMSKDDDRYKELTADDLARFMWFFYDKNKEPIKIPVPFGLGAIYQKLPEYALSKIFSKEGDFVDNRYKDALVFALLNQLIPVPNAGIFDPIWQYFTNTKFTGAHIVSPYQQKLEPKLQYNANTPLIYKELGDAYNLSPLKLEHLIKGFSGYLETSFAELTQIALWDKEKWGEMPYSSIGDILYRNAFKQFYQQETPRSAFVQEYYKIKEDIDIAYNSLNFVKNQMRLKEDKSLEKYYGSEEKHELNALKAAIKDVDEFMANTNQMTNAITYDKNLTAKQKENQIEDIYKQQKKIFKDVYKQINPIIQKIKKEMKQNNSK